MGIPTFNSALHVQQTIKSLQAQTETNWKCLISDDNSTDETALKVRELIDNDDRFEFFVQSTRLGPEANWNFLLGHAKTQYFKLLHADDLLHPFNLEIALDHLRQNPNCALISSKRKFSANPISEWNKNINKKYFVKDRDQVLNKYLIYGSNFIGEPSFVTFQTKALKEAGGFSKSWEYLIDLDTYFNVLKYGFYIGMKESLGIFRISHNSWSSQLLCKQLKEEYRFLIHTSNKKKRVIFGLALITVRSILRQIYFRIFARLK